MTLSLTSTLVAPSSLTMVRVETILQGVHIVFLNLVHSFEYLTDIMIGIHIPTIQRVGLDIEPEEARGENLLLWGLSSFVRPSFQKVPVARLSQPVSSVLRPSGHTFKLCGSTLTCVFSIPPCLPTSVPIEEFPTRILAVGEGWGHRPGVR
jgi:hypothetical protein